MTEKGLSHKLNGSDSRSALGYTRIYRIVSGHANSQSLSRIFAPILCRDLHFFSASQPAGHLPHSRFRWLASTSSEAAIGGGAGDWIGFGNGITRF